MTKILEISLKNFRIHKDISLKLSPKTTVITGKNGSGKTSIIEAVLAILWGGSFKATDKDLINKNSQWFRLDAKFDDGERTVKYDNSKTSNKKQINIGGRKQQRMSLKDKIPSVLFEPEDLRLLNGSPSRRREFIDSFISQINPNYQRVVNKYERSLRQRNNLLKKGLASKNNLFVWDVAISEYGAEIIEQRTIVIEKINSKINDIYRMISKNNDEVSLHYSNTFIGNLKQKLLNELNQNKERDKTLGYTSTGPHRHDIIFNFNNLPATHNSSRGEIRTIILALKFLEAEIIEEITGKKPIILLDDVFSELDETRQKSLLMLDNQTIITSVKSPANSGGVVIKL